MHNHLVTTRPFTPLCQAAVNRRRRCRAGGVVAVGRLCGVASAGVPTVHWGGVGAGASARLCAVAAGDRAGAPGDVTPLAVDWGWEKKVQL